MTGLAVMGAHEVNRVTPWDFPAGVLLALLPIGIALFSSVLATTVVGLLILTAHLTLWSDGFDLSHDVAVVVALLIGVGGLLGVLVAWHRERTRVTLRAVTEVAEATQRAVLRPIPSRVHDLHIADLYRPSASAARLGGDWYDIQPSPYGIRAVLGDVSGKGLPAVSASAALLGCFREAAYHKEDLSEVGHRLESAVQRYNTWAWHWKDGPGIEAAPAELFSTAVLLQLCDDTPGTVDVLAYGHEPPLIVGADGTVRSPEVEPGLPLGMATLGVAMPTSPTRLPFSEGDTLLLYTDGVNECRSRDGTFYPVRQRMAQLARESGATPEDLVDRLEHDLLAHSGGPLGDDAAIIAIRRVPSRTRPLETAAALHL
ncbi:PP2C family protein-serine/threonine phosphatase [Actinomycetota bacterium Odt1-20B]